MTKKPTKMKSGFISPSMFKMWLCNQNSVLLQVHNCSTAVITKSNIM